jgi:hypothetical protein
MQHAAYRGRKIKHKILCQEFRDYMCMPGIIGATQEAFAKEFKKDLSYKTLWMWYSRGIPFKYLTFFERWTGIPAIRLRPDIAKKLNLDI